jgi:hypothetical protein
LALAIAQGPAGVSVRIGESPGKVIEFVGDAGHIFRIGTGGERDSHILGGAFKNIGRLLRREHPRGDKRLQHPQLKEAARQKRIWLRKSIRCISQALPSKTLLIFKHRLSLYRQNFTLSPTYSNLAHGTTDDGARHRRTCRFSFFRNLSANTKGYNYKLNLRKLH